MNHRQDNSRQASQSISYGSFVLFVLLLSSSGCSAPKPSAPVNQNDAYTAAIHKVFEKDHKAGNIFKSEVKSDRLAAARNYTLALRRIDLRSCPTDFQEAFLKHRYAWDELALLLEKYDGFTGDLLALFELGSAIANERSLTTEGDKEYDRVRRAIAASYFEVEKIALRYGVQAGH